MIQELLYTSAPKGLKSGSQGFCTVLSSAGMSAPVAAALEALSGYRPVYPQGDPRVHSNPVVYSHLLCPLAGKRHSVLSRIADYGLDYSQRTNKIAHHVAIDLSDRIPAGPAWLLQAPDFMRDGWDGTPQVVSAERPLPQGANPPRIAETWQQLTGDAGWAGVLAESFLQNPDRLVFLIFEPGMPMLSLIDEAIALLPPQRRWEVTFSTYFTKVPNGVICQWRCLLADSPEAHESRRHVQALRLDLTAPLGRATGGELVEVARTGQPTQVTAEQSVAPAEIESAATAIAGMGPPSSSMGTAAAAEAPRGRPQPPASERKVVPPVPLEQSYVRKKRGSSAGKRVAVILTSVILLVGAVVGAKFLMPTKPPSNAVAEHENASGQSHTDENDRTTIPAPPVEQTQPSVSGGGSNGATDIQQQDDISNESGVTENSAGEGGEKGREGLPGGDPVASSEKGTEKSDGVQPQANDPGSNGSEKNNGEYSPPGTYYLDKPSDQQNTSDQLNANDRLPLIALRLPDDVQLSVCVPADLSERFRNKPGSNEGLIRVVQSKASELDDWSDAFSIALGDSKADAKRELVISAEQIIARSDLSRMVFVFFTDSDKWTVLPYQRPDLFKSEEDQGANNVVQCNLPGHFYNHSSVTLHVNKCTLKVSEQVVELLVENPDAPNELKDNAVLQASRELWRHLATDRVAAFNRINVQTDTIFSTPPPKVSLTFENTSGAINVSLPLKELRRRCLEAIKEHIQGRNGFASIKFPQLAVLSINDETLWSQIALNKNIDTLEGGIMNAEFQIAKAMKHDEENPGEPPNAPRYTKWKSELEEEKQNVESLVEYVKMCEGLFQELQRSKLVAIDIEQYGTCGMGQDGKPIEGWFPLVKLDAKTDSEQASQTQVNDGAPQLSPDSASQP